ncbi:hepatic leukemia factor isoform X3 [Octodon degus]|uniref:Hepatic leukemia factor isoform X3 n=1 Tax=Octodon degus TaxID=10160 RepID=A0A6P6DMJ1_OCTDE|nr:hepatic leukemia factor isoform X3 [Octodon degus]
MEKMSRQLPLNPTFIPPPYGVLRSLLENPLKLPLHQDDAFSKDKDKEKKLDDESNSPTVPQSAFLGPTLWDKTLPYDGDTFQLEYMDLEEFLSENGIPPSPSQHDHSPHPPGLQPAASTAPSVMDLSSRASAPLHPGIPSPNCMQSPIRPGELQQGPMSTRNPDPGRRKLSSGEWLISPGNLFCAACKPDPRPSPLSCLSASRPCLLCPTMVGSIPGSWRLPRVLAKSFRFSAVPTRLEKQQ